VKVLLYAVFVVGLWASVRLECSRPGARALWLKIPLALVTWIPLAIVAWGFTPRDVPPLLSWAVGMSVAMGLYLVTAFFLQIFGLKRWREQMAHTGDGWIPVEDSLVLPTDVFLRSLDLQNAGFKRVGTYLGPKGALYLLHYRAEDGLIGQIVYGRAPSGAPDRVIIGLASPLDVDGWSLSTLSEGLGMFLDEHCFVQTFPGSSAADVIARHQEALTFLLVAGVGTALASQLEVAPPKISDMQGAFTVMASAPSALIKEESTRVMKGIHAHVGPISENKVMLERLNRLLEVKQRAGEDGQTLLEVG
jgi:hypothetical protein